MLWCSPFSCSISNCILTLYDTVMVLDPRRSETLVQGASECGTGGHKPERGSRAPEGSPRPLQEQVVRRERGESVKGTDGRLVPSACTPYRGASTGPGR